MRDDRKLWGCRARPCWNGLILLTRLSILVPAKSQPRISLLTQQTKLCKNIPSKLWRVSRTKTGRPRILLLTSGLQILSPEWTARRNSLWEMHLQRALSRPISRAIGKVVKTWNILWAMPDWIKELHCYLHSLIASTTTTTWWRTGWAFLRQMRWCLGLICISWCQSAKTWCLNRQRELAHLCLRRGAPHSSNRHSSKSPVAAMIQIYRSAL